MSDVPESLNKKVTRVLHERGMELTPDEVAAARRSAHAKIRAAMRAKGYEVPEGEMEFIAWMRMVLAEG